jgi:putative nucleotidyltransferase with HDIG domain
MKRKIINSKRIIVNSNGAFNLLKELGAPQKLITHSELVLEAAEEIIEEILKCTSLIDFEFVRIGAILHDVGKVLHPNELVKAGQMHQMDGKKMLLELGVDEKIARCCLSHSNYEDMECSIEELLIALSNNLWKGKRVKNLESKIIEWIKKLFDQNGWVLSVKFDETFEKISEKGLGRLIRS